MSVPSSQGINSPVGILGPWGHAASRQVPCGGHPQGRAWEPPDHSPLASPTAASGAFFTPGHYWGLLHAQGCVEPQGTNLGNIKQELPRDHVTSSLKKIDPWGWRYGLAVKGTGYSLPGPRLDSQKPSQQSVTPLGLGSGSGSRSGLGSEALLWPQRTQT